jgi:hypothetical protein
VVLAEKGKGAMLDEEFAECVEGVREVKCGAGERRK